MKLENVKAVITGAGSGLGEGTARYLKDRGAKLLLIDLNAEGPVSYTHLTLPTTR